MAAKVEEAYSERTEKVNAAGEMVEVNLDGDSNCNSRIKFSGIV